MDSVVLISVLKLKWNAFDRIPTNFSFVSGKTTKLFSWNCVKCDKHSLRYDPVWCMTTPYLTRGKKPALELEYSSSFELKGNLSECPKLLENYQVYKSSFKLAYVLLLRIRFFWGVFVCSNLIYTKHFKANPLIDLNCRKEHNQIWTKYERKLTLHLFFSDRLCRWYYITNFHILNLTILYWRVLNCLKITTFQKIVPPIVEYKARFLLCWIRSFDHRSWIAL